MNMDMIIVTGNEFTICSSCSFVASRCGGVGFAPFEDALSMSDMIEREKKRAVGGGVVRRKGGSVNGFYTRDGRLCNRVIKL